MASEVTSEKNLYESRRNKHRPERHGFTGPVILVALGVVFLVGEFVPSWGVSKTWPILLIVIGVTKLLESVLSRG